MSTTTTRNSRSRLLALLASLAMIAAGLLGVAVAAPAQAAGNIDIGNNNPAKVCAAAGFTGGWARIDASGKVTSGGAGGYSVSATGLPGKSGTWTSSPAAGAVFLHAGDKTLNKDMGSGSSGEWSDPQHGISTLTFCYGVTYSATKTSGGTANYCLAGTDGSYGYFGSGSATSTVSQADADKQAQDAADAAALADKTAKLPSGATAGSCTTYTGEKTTSGTAQYCAYDEDAEKDVTGSYEYSGTGKATSKLSQDDADAKAQTLADAAAAADKASKLPSGATPGACGEPKPFTSTKTAGGTADYCLAGTNGSFTYFGSGTASSTVSQTDADELAQKAADDAAAADKTAKLPSGAKEGTCEVFTGTAKSGGSVAYCLNGSNGSFDYSGTGEATSTVSQADAEAKAKADADAAASADRTAKLPEGATVGTCTPDSPDTPKTPETPDTPKAPETPSTPETPVTTSVVEPATVETPATVAVPAAATVPAPATVAVPSAATLPAAVPAGGGSTAPGIPTWAIALIVLGAVGAATAGITALKR